MESELFQAQPLDVAITAEDRLMPIGSVTSVLGNMIVIQVGCLLAPKELSVTLMPCLAHTMSKVQGYHFTLIDTTMPCICSSGLSLNAPLAQSQKKWQKGKQFQKPLKCRN